ncbi:hypothetical protein [Chitinophaga skermanii]|nr:hypothetical protein [Chitinophaga skermanii]
MRYTLFIFTICVLGMLQESTAQQKTPVKKPATTTAKPATTGAKQAIRFKSSWGLNLSDSIPRPLALSLLDSALRVRDQTNTLFPVQSFEFTYVKKEPYINDTTEQISFYTETTGDIFKGAKLDTLWQGHLRRSLEKGDELWFNDIIIKYKEDKLYRVPSLKFEVR